MLSFSMFWDARVRVRGLVGGRLHEMGALAAAVGGEQEDVQ